jgi:hypothetical protein
MLGNQVAVGDGDSVHDHVDWISDTDSSLHRTGIDGSAREESFQFLAGEEP